DYGLNREEFYEGYASDETVLGQRVAADVDWAHSDANGTIPLGDNHFDRVAARVQLASATSQTDLFAGYQAKFFGWPNLYTPFNSPESENLQALLFAFNHRIDLGAGDYLEAGVYHRRNKDDYAFNRFAPLGPVHPFQHPHADEARDCAREDLGARRRRAPRGQGRGERRRLQSRRDRRLAGLRTCPRGSLGPMAAHLFHLRRVDAAAKLYRPQLQSVRRAVPRQSQPRPGDEPQPR